MYLNHILIAALTHCFQNGKEMIEKMSSLPADEHIPLSQYMFALAIKGIAMASFGVFFKDHKEVLKLRKNFDLVIDV